MYVGLIRESLKEGVCDFCSGLCEYVNFFIQKCKFEK